MDVVREMAKKQQSAKLRRYNFHLYGFGNYRTEGDAEIVPHTTSRWSINMFAFRAADLDSVNDDKLGEDDESQLSYVQPHRLNKASCAVGKALAVHFSYSKQEEGLLANTDLLAQYANLTRDFEH